MKTEARYPELIGLKLSRELAEEIRRQAREDDRTVSGYLRRIIMAAVRPAQAREGESR